MRIAILGVLAPHKGREVVRRTVEASVATGRFFTIIGFSDPPLLNLRNLRETGAYKDDEDLLETIKKLKTDVIWFPSQVPETFSYTLSAAIASRKPIVATRIGAFIERLVDYPYARLENVDVQPETWLAALDLAFQDSKRDGRQLSRPKKLAFRSSAFFYRHGYLPSNDCAESKQSVLTKANIKASNRMGFYGSKKGLPHRRIKVILIPETLQDGRYSPCAYIRLLHPYEWLRSIGEIDLLVVNFEDALNYRADVFVLQRHSLRTLLEVTRLVAWIEKINARLVYDLDDNLLDVPMDHPEFHLIAEKSLVVRTLVQEAAVVTVSTQPLAGIVEKEASGRVVLIRNALDSSLVKLREADGAGSGRGMVGILYMGTMTHERDFKLVAPVLKKLNRGYSGKLRIGVIGVTREKLPHGIVRVEVPSGVQASYPAFFSWLQRLTDWHIGLAPLEDNAFNKSKSDIKALDYMSMGLVPMVSEVVSYSELPDKTVVRVGHSSRSWEDSLRALIEDEHYRIDLVKTGYSYLMSERVIGTQNVRIKSDWKIVLGRHC